MPGEDNARRRRSLWARPDRAGALRPLVLTVLLSGTSVVAQAPPASSSLESTDTIHVAIFGLEAGTIYVNVPDDLRPGETASGTVNPVPTGAGDDLKRHREELNGHSVVLAGHRAPVSDAVRTFTVPANANILSIVLVDRHGAPVAEVQAPLGPTHSAAASYEVPTVGQAGAPVRITGPFDGDLSNSSVQIDGSVADPIAESQRQLVVRGPKEGAAEAPVEVRERGVQVKSGTYRNVNVRLSAGATTLHSGETTTLTVTLTGVEGLRETLPVHLSNNSPGVVRMEGG